MSRSLLLRRGAPLAATRACASLSPSEASKLLSSSFSTFNVSRYRLVVHTPSCSLLLARPLVLPIGTAWSNATASSVVENHMRRFFSLGRTPWPSGNDWKSTLKTGGLVLLGTGALIVSTSLAFGLVIAGAAGYGVYTLYQRFFSPFRSHFRTSRDPLSNISSNIDTLHDMFSRTRQRRKSPAQDELNSLVQGLPFVVRGFVKTIFGFVGKAMQTSMERAGELRRRTNEHLQANKRVRDQMGDNVSVGGPEQWLESTVNGIGRIEAVFPVHGAYGSARVTMKASVGQGGKLEFTELKYHNRQTGDTIDLLRDSPIGGRPKTIIDAEYVDLENQESKSQW